MYWVESLHWIVQDKISLDISIDEFKYFFKNKQQKTSSSPSGRQLGHYKTILECIRRDNYTAAEIIIKLAQISLLTASPLTRWQTASQVMLGKGKGQFIEQNRIIQLCTADLNFILHVIWSH